MEPTNWGTDLCAMVGAAVMVFGVARFMIPLALDLFKGALTHAAQASLEVKLARMGDTQLKEYLQDERSR